MGGSNQSRLLYCRGSEVCLCVCIAGGVIDDDALVFRSFGVGDDLYGRDVCKRTGYTW